MHRNGMFRACQTSADTRDMLQIFLPRRRMPLFRQYGFASWLSFPVVQEWFYDLGGKLAMRRDPRTFRESGDNVPRPHTIA